jgi:DNA-binding LacI/PurR family transcriptional regulator
MAELLIEQLRGSPRRFAAEILPTELVVRASA